MHNKIVCTRRRSLLLCWYLFILSDNKLIKFILNLRSLAFIYLYRPPRVSVAPSIGNIYNLNY